MMNNYRQEIKWIRVRKIVTYFLGLAVLVVGGYYGLIAYDVLSTPNDYAIFSNEIIAKAEAYVTNNSMSVPEGDSVYLSFTEINFEFPKTKNDNKCSKSGGVVVAMESGNIVYTPYFVCETISSLTVNEALSHNAVYDNKVVLKGNNPLVLGENETYTEPGYDISDNTCKITPENHIGSGVGIYYVNYDVICNDIEFNLTRVVASNNINGTPSKSDFYMVKTYNEVDYAKEYKYIPQNQVVNVSFPSLKLSGTEAIYLNKGDKYKEPGYTASDSKDGNITSKVTVSGSVNTSTKGVYVLTYRVVNSSGKVDIKYRTVVVSEKNTDPNAPTITLKGTSSIKVTKGNSYIEPGYTASDKKDGDITSKVKVSGTPNTNVVGTYTITYSVTNSLGKTDAITRIVIVEESTVTAPSVSISKNPSTSTSGTVNIVLTITGSYNYTTLPNQMKSTETTVTYPVKTNGTYNFTVYDRNNVGKNYSVSVTNIISSSNETTPTPGGNTSNSNLNPKAYVPMDNTWCNGKIIIKDGVFYYPEHVSGKTSTYSGKSTCSKGPKGTSSEGLNYTDGVNEEFYKMLKAFFQAGRDAGYKFNIAHGGGWRSYEAQDNCRKVNSNCISIPGASLHGWGLAADLWYKSSSKDGKWAHDHAKEFGFKFRINSEYWHIEPLNIVKYTKKPTF